MLRSFAKSWSGNDIKKKAAYTDFLKLNGDVEKRLKDVTAAIESLFDEITVEIGHVVDIIPYAYSGSSDLVDNVIGKLRNACHCYLMQNHGALSLGSDVQQAMKNAELLENVAKL